MPSALTIVGSLLLIYVGSLAYNLIVNIFNARKSNFPYIIIPWDQNGFFWMVASVPLRPWLSKTLPKWIWDRLSMTIYGVEFYEKLRPFEQYAAPQGNDKTYAIVTPGRFEMSTRDRDIVAEIISRPNDFLPIDLTALFLGRFGPNVLTSYGEPWARQRKIVASVINERISKAVFNESIYQTEGLVGEVIGEEQVAETNRIFDMMKKITINVLSGTGMGTRVDWNDHANEKPSAGFHMTYNEAVKHLVNNVMGPIILPQWFLDFYPSFLPGYTNMKALGHAVTEFPVHTRKHLDQERELTKAAHGQARGNIMAQMLQASEAGDTATTTGKKSTGLTEEEMLGNTFVFTAAGFDTTANTLSYALALMCRYPAWQAWLCEEIDAIMPPNNHSSSAADLDYATLFPRAQRIQACMYEVLRLFPPVVHLAKMTKTAQTMTTSRGTYHVPADAIVYVHSVGLHLDPSLWRNLNLAAGETPSEDDECRFRPTRWLVSAGEKADGVSTFFKPPKGAYVPWSGGARICPGQKMALVEFTAIFLRLFREHRVEAVRLSVKGEDTLREESDEEVGKRLDAVMGNSVALLTLQMDGVYDVVEGEKGLKLRLNRREKMGR